MIITIPLMLMLIANGMLELLSRSMLLSSALKSNGGGGAAPRAVIAPGALAGRFISVHLAIHNEPPALVIATLQAIAASDFEPFEVIIVDNNTADPAVWRPVEAAARALGDRFRFFHVDHLVGAKAGALNIALAATSTRATHIAIIDADYQVSRGFFTDALAALIANGADYVQFPQAYRGVSIGARGVEQELGDYFACFATGALRPGSMLPTGTLSLFTAAALRNVGGWNPRTITEDAEIGVRLQSAGHRGLWVAARGGDGVLPLDYRGLATQRARWAAGNVQVLRRVIVQRWVGLSVRDFANLVAQLTAWVSFWALPALVLLVVAVLPRLPLAGPLGWIAAATIIASSALTALRMAPAVSLRDQHWRVCLAALAAKLALTWTSALAWLPALVNRRLRFHRTPKAASAGRRDPLVAQAAASFAFALAALHYAVAGGAMEAMACALLAGVWPCARSVDRCLKQSASSQLAAA